MVKSAIIEDIHDPHLRYVYISFGILRTRYGWYASLLNVMPPVADLSGSTKADMFISWIQSTRTNYKIINIFANDDFTDELRIDDYPELLI